MPAGFASLVEQCLAKDPGARPESADVLQDRLEGLTAQATSGHEVAFLRREPSPRTLGNLPVPVDSFVAREQEIEELRALLANVRLVTLVGVGGTGKTRLALETARSLASQFADGVWLVELAPVTKGEVVPHVVADLLGVVQQPDKTIIASLVDSLRNRSLLLVLDNCEHVLDEAAEVAAAISTQCATVRILVTSRESLAIRGEQVVRIHSLSDEQGAELFRDRARAAGATGSLDLDTLARLSQRLDGMPLAIELAAARSGMMSPEEIEQRLDDRFRLLRGSRRGRMERHHTLRNTVAWSYDLLEPMERQVFNRLSAFAGGFTLAAAQAVAGGEDLDALDVADAVTQLVGRSMVLATDIEGCTRYRLLETLRQFGEEQLIAAGEAGTAHERHLRFFAEFMEAAWSGLWSAEDARWIRAVGSEFENLRLAVYTAIDTADSEALAALLKPHIWWAWHALRYEVADWAQAALEVVPEPRFVRAVAVHLHMHGGRPGDATDLATRLPSQAEAVDAEEASFAAWGHLDASILAEEPSAGSWLPRWIDAERQSDNAARAAAVQSIEVAFRLMAGDTAEACRIADACYEAAQITGNQTSLCWTSFFVGRAHSSTDPERALAFFERSLELAERTRLPLIGGIAATEAAVILARVGDPGQGHERLSRAILTFIKSGDRRQLWTSAHHLAFFLARAQRVDDAGILWRELGERQAWAAQSIRDELAAMLGPPSEAKLSDDQLVEHIRAVLATLEAESG